MSYVTGLVFDYIGHMFSWAVVSRSRSILSVIELESWACRRTEVNLETGDRESGQPIAWPDARLRQFMNQHLSSIDDSGGLNRDILRTAFGCFPSGVTAACGLIRGEPVGMVASSFTSVSLDPPMASICIAHTSTTWPVLKMANRIGLSVLAHDHHEVARALAAKGANRFESVAWEASERGAVFVHGAPLWLECLIDREIRAGDHDIVLLGIESVHPKPDIAPMVFHRSSFRRLAV
jgi:flavin reductase (DIM6/NTAB) family NADH-FMN oxidoreductase RutF